MVCVAASPRWHYFSARPRPREPIRRAQLRRYHVFVNLFIFAMLLAVSANNVGIMGWVVRPRRFSQRWLSRWRSPKGRWRPRGNTSSSARWALRWHLSGRCFAISILLPCQGVLTMRQLARAAVGGRVCTRSDEACVCIPPGWLRDESGHRADAHVAARRPPEAPSPLSAMMSGVSSQSLCMRSRAGRWWWMQRWAPPSRINCFCCWGYSPCWWPL